MNLVCLSGPRFVEHPTLLARGFATNAAFTVCARSRTRLTVCEPERLAAIPAAADAPRQMISPPAGYSTPRFPSLNIDTLYDETDDRRYTLYYIADVWYYTTLWTLIVYIFFHLGAVGIAMFTHSWTKSSWKYIWVVPLSYILVAGVEALISGSIVGVM